MAAPGFSLRIGSAALVDRLGITGRKRAMLFRTANELKNTWQRHLAGPGGGKVYTHHLRTFRGRVIPVAPRPRHQASAPGQAPARDTGALHGSISVRFVRRDTTRIASDQESAVHMEYGVTDHPAGIVIAPRPHARPAMTEWRGRASRTAATELRGR